MSTAPYYKVYTYFFLVITVTLLCWQTIIPETLWDLHLNHLKFLRVWYLSTHSQGHMAGWFIQILQQRCGWLPWPSNCCTLSRVSSRRNGRGSEVLYLVSLLCLQFLNVTSFFGCIYHLTDFSKSFLIPKMWHGFHPHLSFLAAVQNGW